VYHARLAVFDNVPIATVSTVISFHGDTRSRSLFAEREKRADRVRVFPGLVLQYHHHHSEPECGYLFWQLFDFVAHEK